MLAGARVPVSLSHRCACTRRSRPGQETSSTTTNHDHPTSTTIIINTITRTTTTTIVGLPWHLAGPKAVACASDSTFAAESFVSENRKKLSTPWNCHVLAHGPLPCTVPLPGSEARSPLVNLARALTASGGQHQPCGGKPGAWRGEQDKQSYSSESQDTHTGGEQTYRLSRH